MVVCRQGWRALCGVFVTDLRVMTAEAETETAFVNVTTNNENNYANIWGQFIVSSSVLSTLTVSVKQANNYYAVFTMEQDSAHRVTVECSIKYMCLSKPTWDMYRVRYHHN